MDNKKKNQVDLLYLTNPNFLGKYNKTQSIVSKNSAEDITFYRKRILVMTKYFLRGEKINNTINAAFDNYVEQLIKYFKFIDKKDIVQKEYEHIIVKKKPPEKNFKIMEQNEIIMKDKKNTNKTILDFLPIVVKEKARKKIVIPKQKIYDIKNPSLREKGIKK
ncbi:MAG: hypothetical protein CL678_02035 [Bdellovibrionaceae bacterium]|nr:hypothetical protein [Pseudobdellovibrionaceae bacterium]|tara:strand:+ start:1981 stop:2469 length:489 start_codon:yes stop_codon:yes gene_type:complete